MPSAGPRISAVVERPVYQAVAALAKADGVSVSQKARDLIRDALWLFEDAALNSLVEQRRKISRRSYPLAEVKRRYRLQ